jgi:molybdate transport system substrate-binding protein
MQRLPSTFLLTAAVFLAVPLRASATAAGATSVLCGTVTVAAAADLTYAMEDIAANFEKASGCVLRVSLGSSGNFLTQIENGAPFDVFFSADVQYPRQLETAGLAAPGSTYVYAVGEIVLWARSGSSIDLKKGLAVLRDPGIRTISIANPEHAPYGRAAEQALRNAGLYDAVKGRLVLGENISQAAEFVESGNADIGILALSLARSPGLAGKGRFEPVPADLYSPIEQGVVVMRGTTNPVGARQLIEYMKTPAATAILERYGFVLSAKDHKP